MQLTALDLVVFFGALIGAMAVGMYAGRKEETAEAEPVEKEGGSRWSDTRRRRAISLVSYTSM